MRISDWSSDVCSSDLTWKVLQKYTATSFDVTKYPLGPALPDFDSRYSDADFWTNAYAQAQASEGTRSEEHTSELQTLMRISYAVFCLKKKQNQDKLNIRANTANQTTHSKPNLRTLN